MRAFFILLFIFLFTSVLAQNTNFVGGVFINANGVHFEGDNQIFWRTPSGKVTGGGGLSAGIYVKRHLSEKIYFGLELRYIQKGSVFEYGNLFQTRSVETMRINYAEIPVSVGYTFKTNKKDYFFETGLAYGKQISANLYLNKFTSENDISNIDQFKENDLSWVGSLKFPINEKRKNNLLFGIRTSYSLKSIHRYYNLRNWVYGVQVDYLIR